MRRIALAIAIATSAGLVASAFPTAGRETDLLDPNDTPGRLDVRAVRSLPDVGPPGWRIVTFARWSPKKIWDRGYLLVELDMRGDEGAEHLVVVRSDGRDLVADLFRVRRDGTQVRIGAARTGKDGPRQAWVTVALHRLAVGRGRTSYSWAVLTSWTGRTCPRTCLDRVPETGMVVQPLPGVTPTPTPSPTPTPTTTRAPSP